MEERILTKAEQKRKIHFEQTKAKMEQDGYQAHDVTIGINYANMMAFVYCLPIMIILTTVFIVKNPIFPKILGNRLLPSLSNLMVFLVATIVMTVLHELVHGITWALFAPGHWRSISFGFIAKYLTPYCNCNEALKRWAYIAGAFTPLLLVGVIPSVIAIVTGSRLLFLLGIMMVFGGGGDLTIIVKLLQFKTEAKDIYCVDHPYLLGLVVFTR